MHIPYGGAPQGVSAVMAGETDFGFYNTPSVSSLVKERKLRALAATGTIRTPMLPEVPTMMEAGVAGYVMSVDFGLLAPAGTPDDVVLKLNRAANAAMAQPKLQRDPEELWIRGLRTGHARRYGKAGQRGYRQMGAHRQAGESQRSTNRPARLSLSAGRLIRPPAQA